jgi:hypothetical protein
MTRPPSERRRRSTSRASRAAGRLGGWATRATATAAGRRRQHPAGARAPERVPPVAVRRHQAARRVRRRRPRPRKEAGEGAAQAVALQPGQLGGWTSLAAVPTSRADETAPPRTAAHRRGLGRAARGGRRPAARSTSRRRRRHRRLRGAAGRPRHRVTVVDPSPDALASLQRGPARPASRSARSRATRPACSTSSGRQRRPGALPRRPRARRRPGPRPSALARCCAPAAPSACWSPRATRSCSPGRSPAGSPRRGTPSTTRTAAGAGRPAAPAVHRAGLPRCSTPPGCGSRRSTASAPSPTWSRRPGRLRAGAAEALVELELATAALPEFRALATQLHVRPGVLAVNVR